MTTSKPIPVLGICAAKAGSGKTTLICRLITILAKRGIRVSVIKHTHHDFEIDQVGKDSYQIHHAGAVQTLLGNAQKWAMVSQLPNKLDDDQELIYLLEQIDSAVTDLVLVEGFKHALIDKIEVHRAALNTALLANQNSRFIAVASDTACEAPCPVLDLNQVEMIANFIMHHFALGSIHD